MSCKPLCRLIFSRPAFEEVNIVSLPGPHVHVCIHSARGNSTPADLHCDWVSIAGPVVPVLIQPVPAVSHEVGVKADDHLPVGRLLLPDPIKDGAESSLTAPCDLNKRIFFKNGFMCHYFNMDRSSSLWVSLSRYPLDGAVTIEVLYSLPVHPAHLKS